MHIHACRFECSRMRVCMLLCVCLYVGVRVCVCVGDTLFTDMFKTQRYRDRHEFDLYVDILHGSCKTYRLQKCTNML